MKQICRKSIALIAALMLAISLVSCSSKGSSDNVHSSKNSINSTAGEVAYTEAQAAEMSSDELSGGYADAEYYDLSDNTQSGSASLPAGNMLIRNMTLSVETENFDQMFENIRTQVSEKQGYFENMSVNGTGKENDYKYGTFVIRVPADKLDELASSLSGFGTVTYTSETTEDVTLDYVDIQSHLSALRTEQESLLALLEEAEDLETIIELQNYLTDIRYEIESYESQSRTMENLVDYATLTLNVSEVVKEEEPVDIEDVRNETLSDKMRSEFNDSISDVKESGKDLLVSIARNTPYFVVRLPIFIIIGFVVVKVIKKFRKRKTVNNTVPTTDKTPSEKA